MTTSDIILAQTDFFYERFSHELITFPYKKTFFNEKIDKNWKIVLFIFIFHLGIMPIFRAKCIWCPMNSKIDANLENILVLNNNIFMFLPISLFLTIPIIQ